MTAHPSALDRLEARVAAQEARIEELYRLLHATPDPRRIPEPRRRPRQGRPRTTARS